jgi:hypothetical protein
MDGGDGFGACDVEFGVLSTVGEVSDGDESKRSSHAISSNPII